MFALAATVLALFASYPLSANDNAGVIQLTAPPAALRTDSAYLLLQTSTAKSGMFMIQHVILRIPSAQEMETYRAAKRRAYDAALPELVKKARGGAVPSIDKLGFDYNGRANTFVVEAGKFLEDGEMRTILLEMPPGTYVIYGSTLSRGIVTCNCLGTVKFSAKPGVITNLGALYADKVHKPSPVPHLEDNLGPTMFEYGFIFGQALVPANASTPVPASLRQFPTVPVQLDVVGPYLEPGAASINRLAPIPGILDFKHGRPVDLRTGAESR